MSNYSAGYKWIRTSPFPPGPPSWRNSASSGPTRAQCSARVFRVPAKCIFYFRVRPALPSDATASRVTRGAAAAASAPGGTRYAVL